MHVDRQLALEHRAHLDGARVGAHHEVAVDRVDEEGVLHLPRGVVDVEVQRVEVEPLVLELGPFGDLPAHADEDVADLLLQEGERMPRPDARALRERRDVEALGLEPGGDLGRGELLLAGDERLRHAAARLTDELAELRLALGCDIAQPGVQPRERRALGGVRGTRGLQRGGVGGGADGVEGVLDRGIHRLRGDFGSVRHESRVYRRPAGRPVAPAATGSRRSGAAGVVVLDAAHRLLRGDRLGGGRRGVGGSGTRDDLRRAPEAPLHEARDVRQREAERYVDRARDDGRGDERRPEDRIRAEQLREVEQLGVRDDEAERGVLQGHDELRDDDRQHRPDRLRQQDQGA